MKQKSPYKKAEYLEFIKFTATPRMFRDAEFGYVTDKAFAEKFKLNETTLVEWKKDRQFQEAVKDQLKIWAKNRTPDVIACLYKEIIKNGRAAEVKLWMQLFEGFTEKTESALSVHSAQLKELQDANVAIFEMAKKREREEREAQKNQTKPNSTT